jgi:hypothetical protein
MSDTSHETPDTTHGMPDTTHAFVSYSHKDAIIAEEIERQLIALAEKGKGKAFLKCFLDTKSIPPAQRYQPIIRSALEQTDWLIVVFTGNQSVYCGYEIGIYSVVSPHDDMAHEDKPITCLHDVDQSRIPGVLDGYNTTLVTQVAPYTANDPIPSGQEVNLWWQSPVGRFLRAFCSSKDLYTANDCANPSEYTVDIAKAAKQICHAFELARQEDEVGETPIQAGFEITIYPSLDGALRRIPESSPLKGSSLAFQILGLSLPFSVSADQAPQTTWGEVRQALSEPGRANIPWMDKLEINISLAASLRTPEPDDVTFKGKQDGRIYRALLTRHKLYRNGMRRFYVLLVETFDRRFVGDRQTSLLLIALTLASRWRFTFFERWSETVKQFDASRSDRDFQIACRQLEYNMDWMEHEGVELGADDMGAMVDAFGYDNRALVESFYSDWETAKKELDRQLPQTFEGLTAEARTQTQTAIITFLTKIKAQNADFLKLCIDKYAEKMRCNSD